MSQELNSVYKLFNYTKMESGNKLTMCRLCLCENECFINIFQMNDWQGYVASEVISDLLQFQVSISDDYPHVVCFTCITKLTDFKNFKQFCLKSKDVYDKMLVSSIEDQPEMVQPAPEETVTPDLYLQCQEHERPQYASKRGVDAEPCNIVVNIDGESTFEESKNISLSAEFEASSSGTTKGLEGKLITPGDEIYVAPPLHRDLGNKKGKKKVGMEKKVVRGRGTDSEKGVEDERERLECSNCGNVFMSKHDLIQHIKVHEFDHHYDCDVCGKVFQSNRDLIKHVLTHTGSKPYKCTECSKCFSDSSYLKVHMKSHTVYKPYTCAECSKSFNQSSALNRHMRTHTGSKPYICVQCSKRFSQNSTLKTHMRSHTGSKPFKCGTCSKEFSDRSNFIRHKLIHTNEKDHECLNCKKRFKRRNDLKIHLERHCKGKRK